MGMPDLGQEAINKVAELGIKSQLDEVESLEVELETDPLKLMTGKVDAVSIEGEGMVMQKDLRMEEMSIHTSEVAINPMSAAFGKIELQRPTHADVHVVLADSDINRAFHSDFVREKLQNVEVQVNGDRATVDTQSLEFGLPEAGKIYLSTRVNLPQEQKRVAFTCVPKMTEGGHKIVLEDLHYIEGQDLSPELTQALLQQAESLLDLRNFELEGMSLRLKKLDVQPGKLTLESEALVEQFPST
jgi:hypothetical protein